MKCKEMFASMALRSRKIATVLPICKTGVDRMSIVKFG